MRLMRFSSRLRLGGMIQAMNDGLSIAASGLQAASLWLNITASNIANMNDASPAPDAPAVPNAPTAYQPLTVSQSPSPDGGVSATPTPVSPASTLAYDPAQPFANLQGMVAMPNVDLASQLVDLTEAKASYRASLAVYQASSDMFKSLLDMAV